MKVLMRKVEIESSYKSETWPRLELGPCPYMHYHSLSSTRYAIEVLIKVMTEDRETQTERENLTELKAVS